MQPDQDEADYELLALAQATDRAADAIADPEITARLRVIANGVRAMARCEILSKAWSQSA